MCNSNHLCHMPCTKDSKGVNFSHMSLHSLGSQAGLGGAPGIMHRGTQIFIDAVSWILYCAMWTTAGSMSTEAHVNGPDAASRHPDAAANPLRLSSLVLQEDAYFILFLWVPMNSLEVPSHCQLAQPMMPSVLFGLFALHLEHCSSHPG